MSLAPERVAYHYLGRPPTDHEVCICTPTTSNPEPPIQFDPEFDPAKRTCLLYTSCHAYQLRHYLQTRADFSADFNIHIMLVHVMLLSGMNQQMPALVSAVLPSVEVVLMHDLLGDYDSLNLKYHVKTLPRSVLFPPPNCNACWPISTLWGSRELEPYFKSGLTPTEVFALLTSGKFNPRFAERMAAELVWLGEREAGCDIRISGFVERHFRTHKLWFTENHPTYNLEAWIASEFLRVIGYSPDDEEAILSLPHDELGTWNHNPETHYEWEHYGFTYPMRYGVDKFGWEHYRDLITTKSSRPTFPQIK
jgi:hypothetical protein